MSCGIIEMSLKSTEQDVLVALHVQLFVNLWTVARQAPLSRQEYWNGLPFPSPKGTIEKKKVKLHSHV